MESRLHRFEQPVDNGLHVRSVTKDGRVAPGAHARLPDFLVIRDPGRQRRGPVDHAAQELNPKRVLAVSIEGGLCFGLERRVARRRFELAGEGLIVEEQAKALARKIGMGDEIQFEELDSAAELARPDGRCPADPVADIVDRVIPFGRVDEHRAHAVSEKGIGQRIDAGQKRCRIGRHERRIGFAIGKRPEHLRRPCTRLSEQRARVVETGLTRCTGSIREHDDARPGALQQVMRAKLVTGVSKDQNPRCAGSKE